MAAIIATYTRVKRDQNMDRQKLLEWTGVTTAILYSMLIAFNIGAEFVGSACYCFQHF